MLESSSRRPRSICRHQEVLARQPQSLQEIRWRMHPQRTCANQGLPEEVTVRNSLFFAFDKYVAQMVCPESGQLNVTSRRINLVHEGRPPLRGSFRVMRTLRAACLKLSSTWSMSSFSESGLSVPSDVCGPVVDSVYSSHSFSTTLYPAWTTAEETPRVQVAPLFPTSHSLKLTMTPTQCLPSTCGFTFLFTGLATSTIGLPFAFWNISGVASPVWRHLPSDWGAGETDLFRAMLILMRIVREAMLANGAPMFAMNRTEVTFSCMKVFMLEHGQAQGAVREWRGP